MATANTNPSASHLDIMRTVFPVVATTGGGRELARPDFFGTAFAVAPGVFMTASHVVTNALTRGQLAIAGPSGHGPLGACSVDEYEIFTNCDVALLFCNAGGVTLLNTWLTNRVQTLTDLSSFGYPHAVSRADEIEHFEVVFRAYKGYVITTRGFERLPGKPAVYEISVPYPEGMSGAPVLLAVKDQLAVAGVVVGTDAVEYGGLEQRVGIAMIADEILELQSDRLGGLIPERLGFAAATYSPPAP